MSSDDTPILPQPTGEAAPAPVETAQPDESVGPLSLEDRIAQLEDGIHQVTALYQQVIGVLESTSPAEAIKAVADRVAWLESKHPLFKFKIVAP